MQLYCYTLPGVRFHDSWLSAELQTKIFHPIGVWDSGQFSGILSYLVHFHRCRADFKFVPSQWETLIQSNAICHWLGASLEWALRCISRSPFPVLSPTCIWMQQLTPHARLTLVQFEEDRPITSHSLAFLITDAFIQPCIEEIWRIMYLKYTVPLSSLIFK